MNLLLNNTLYTVDESIEVLEIVAIDKAFIYKDTKLVFGYLNYKGSFIQLLGLDIYKSNLALVLNYKAYKFAFLFEDISSSINTANENLSSLIERIINE